MQIDMLCNYFDWDDDDGGDDKDEKTNHDGGTMM